MALAAVVSSALLDRLVEYLRGYESRNGKIGYAMLQRSEGGLNEPWVLTLAAKWLDQGSRLDTMIRISAEIEAHLEPALEGQFGGVLVRSTTDSVVENLVPPFVIAELGTAYPILNSTNLSDYGLMQAVILLYRPELIHIPIAA